MTLAQTLTLPGRAAVAGFFLRVPVFGLAMRHHHPAEFRRIGVPSGAGVAPSLLTGRAMLIASNLRRLSCFTAAGQTPSLRRQ